TITVNGYSGIYDGTPHGANGSASGVQGEDLGSLLDLGANFSNVPGGTAHWSFRPAGNSNYQADSGAVAIDTNKATATITVNGYSGIYDGNAHGASGSASGVQGEDLGSLLDLGASFSNVPGGTAHWSFRPAGNSNYQADSGDVAIAINKATATITVNG